ncbi:30S ribosomal protein S3ae [Cuniculiplasma sp. SKW4]|uniref:30S ribosomal protein S3ae n=1 Tax=Cuniculiplasma sp. SKW4 TaxID=3400171 RepID=UPI003FCFE1AE
MAGERGQKRIKDKWKEKKWFTIMAPNQLGGKEIGMTPGNSGEEIKGRTIEIPISDFTGNFKRSNAKINFKVVECTGMKCSTLFIGHTVNDDYIRRMVRRRKEKIDIVLDVKTTDNYTFTLKIVAIIDGKLTSAKRVELRNAIINIVKERTKNMDYFEFARYVMADESINEILTGVKEIYPLKKLEFRKSELVDTGEKYNFSVPEEAKEEEPVQE